MGGAKSYFLYHVSLLLYILNFYGATVKFSLRINLFILNASVIKTLTL